MSAMMLFAHKVLRKEFSEAKKRVARLRVTLFTITNKEDNYLTTQGRLNFKYNNPYNI